MRATHLHQAPRAVLAGLIALAATVALALPVAPSSASETTREWIVPATTELSGEVEVVEELALIGANIVRSAVPPTEGIPADTTLTWRTEGVPGGDGPVGFEAPDEAPQRGHGPPDGRDAGDGGADAAESDPSPAAAWGDYTDAVAATGAPDAWTTTTTGDQALVALIDTGVAGDVDALDGAIAGEVSFTDHGGGDGHGHGTYMASLIAGAHEVITGSAPDAGIVSLKVGAKDGSTDLGTVLAALEWLHGPGRDLGVRVATLALGVDPGSEAGVLLDIATQRLAAHGMLIVTAAGNEAGAGPSSPATSPGTLAVGSLTADGGVAEFSASGEDRAGNPVPDLYAPGERVLGYHAPDSDIYKAAKEAAKKAGDDDRLERLADGFLQGTGTSASTALTAGVAALVASANPSFNGLDITEALVNGLGDDQHLSAGEALLAAEYIDGTEPIELVGPGNSANAGPPDQPGRPDHGDKPDHAGGPTGEYTPLPIPPVADWTPAQWNDDDRWVAGDWAAERWSGPPAGHPANVTPQIFSWRTADWQSGVWDADSWHASTWTPGHWQQLQYEDAWEIFSWRGDEWEIFSWRSDDWDIFSWRNLSTEIFSWRGDDWDIFSWRAEAWTLMIDE